MSVLTSQAIAFRQLPLPAPDGVKIQFGTDGGRNSSHMSERRPARIGELERASKALESEFFLLFRAEFEKSAATAVVT